MRQIVMDTETTGLDPSDGHRVVELAGVEIVNRLLTGNHLHIYLNPDRESDPEALAIHGLTTAFLSDHPRFPEIADQFLEYIEGAEIIIHNAPFDTKFLNAELAKVGRPRMEEVCGKITDSLTYARELHPGKRNSLDALCERYGISNTHRTLHGALLDSELLADVWLAMTRGQNGLMMDFSDGADSANGLNLQLERIDASSLPIILAQAEELTEHETYLGELDKSSGGSCVWRQF